MNARMGNTELTSSAPPASILTLTEPELRQCIAKENLGSLGQLAHGLAHELNNSLSPIVGFSELLLKDPQKRGNPQLLKRWLTNIHASANRAALVVRRLREFGDQKATGQELTSIDLNQLVQQAIELIEPSWKNPSQSSNPPIHIATHCLPIPHIIGEVFAIREILTNLLANARDAMPTGGRITITTAVDKQFVSLQVSDTGTGMTAAVCQHCFEPFFTTKGLHRSGLGLALVYGIVTRHGGTIAVDSQPGHGTTITLRLPIPPATAGLTENGSSSLSQPCS